MISAEAVRKLREKTGASMMECKNALDKSGGDEMAAEEILRQRGAEIADKKAARATKSGLMDSYLHANRKIGVLLQIDCETDFVAQNEIFKELSHEICLQIAATDSRDNEDLLSQPFIKDQAKTVRDLIREAIGKLGENIKINRFVRFEI